MASPTRMPPPSPGPIGTIRSRLKPCEAHTERTLQALLHPDCEVNGRGGVSDDGCSQRRTTADSDLRASDTVSTPQARGRVGGMGAGLAAVEATRYADADARSDAGHLYWKDRVRAVALIAAAVPMSQRSSPTIQRAPTQAQPATTSVKPPDARPPTVDLPPFRPIARALPVSKEASPIGLPCPIASSPAVQIVRVQMPRASLGALASPLGYPGELVEAEVLLGEDGLARAIRLSTMESAFPGRPR